MIIWAEKYIIIPHSLIFVNHNHLILGYSHPSLSLQCNMLQLAMLRVSKLSKLYTNGDIVIPVLKNITFGLDRGEFVFLTGPSGSGKTTLIKLLILQELPTRGSIVFETVPIEQLPSHLVPAYRRTVGVVFQDYKLLEHKTVFENVAFVLEILNRPAAEVKKTVEYLLDYVGLVDKKDLFPKQLSGGEKRRVVIARAIANNPKLLIADEPTGDLDPQNTEVIMDLLGRINKAGTSIIMTTHNMELLDLYDYAHWHIEQGELQQNARKNKKKTPNEFLKELSEILPESVVNKVKPLNPDEKDDLLNLTPSFLKETLKFTDAEVKILADKLKELA